MEGRFNLGRRAPLRRTASAVTVAIFIALVPLMTPSGAQARTSEPDISHVKKVPVDPEECAQMLRLTPAIAGSDHGCWIEIRTGPRSVARTVDSTAATYLYLNTSVTMTGPFDIWGVTANSKWRYNGLHIYPVFVDCSNHWAAWPYTIDVTWCGRGLSQSYPYTDYGANADVESYHFTFGHGMRQQVWANGNVCCESVW